MPPPPPVSGSYLPGLTDHICQVLGAESQTKRIAWGDGLQSSALAKRIGSLPMPHYNPAYASCRWALAFQRRIFSPREAAHANLGACALGFVGLLLSCSI